jgi:RNA polymerase sigma-70 factor (ECF subfamily)
VNATDLPNRLSQIHTRWSLLFDAHQGQADRAQRAQEALIRRYSGAIYRYLLGAVRDPNVADDLAQEFALRLVRGDFKRADPERGRFRDFVKTSLYHLIVDHQRRKVPRPLPPEVGGREDADEADRQFTARWREGLLNRAWEGLAALEAETGQPFYTVLRHRSENPDESAQQMAERLAGRLGKALTDVAMRKTIQRARERFSNLLLDEVARSLQSEDPERVEQELRDLDLLCYCRSALDRYRRKA